MESHASEAYHQAESNRQYLTTDQKDIFHTVIQTVNDSRNNQQKIFFIDGPAGRGKAFLLNTIIQQLRSLIVGTTALSVTLYERGRTAHSMLGIPITEVSIYKYY